MGASPPKAKEPKEAPDPEAEANKKKQAEERAKIQMRRGTSKTVATSPMGVLGAAPTSRPELKGQLGGY